jgi:hypothetical protein
MGFAFEPAGIPYPFLAWVIHRGAWSGQLIPIESLLAMLQKGF